MNQDKITILYLCSDSSLGGSTQSLFNLINSVKEYVTPVVLVTQQGPAYDLFVKEGVECYVYPFLKLYELYKLSFVDFIQHPWRWHIVKKMRFDYGCRKFVKKKFKDRNIDIVHSNTSPMDIGVSLAKLLKAKHIWHIREFCDLHFNFNIYKGIPRLRNLINSADSRIAISSAIKEHWQLKDDCTWIINDAIRSVNDVCYKEKKEKYLMFCSYYLTEAKGTRNAIISFAKSAVAKDGFVLKLIGNCSDEYRTSLLETIEQLNIKKNVEFVPCQKDVKHYLSEATAYIMSSVSEGLGRVTGEAMFYGCPVIAHASGGTLDLIQDGITGYLFENEDQCAQLIQHVCYENQTIVIQNAQKYAMDHLSEEVYGNKIMEVYKKTLSI